MEPVRARRAPGRWIGGLRTGPAAPSPRSRGLTPQVRRQRRHRGRSSGRRLLHRSGQHSPVLGVLDIDSQPVEDRRVVSCCPPPLVADRPAQARDAPSRRAADTARPPVCPCPFRPRSSPKVAIASAGMQADRQALHKHLHARHVMYQFNHRRPMSCPAMSQLLSNTLYHKRFFPYYTFNLCAGLDDEGACLRPGAQRGRLPRPTPLHGMALPTSVRPAGPRQVPGRPRRAPSLPPSLPRAPTSPAPRTNARPLNALPLNALPPRRQGRRLHVRRDWVV